MARRPFDVAVVGGGPAGSATAWRAAKAGLTVALFDRAQFPRDKPCGDGLTPKAVRSLLRLGLDPEFPGFNRTHSFRLANGRKSLDFAWNAPSSYPDFGLVVRRSDLDHLLLRHAEAAGVAVCEGHEVLGPLIERQELVGLRVRTPSGIEQEVRAETVVAADGASSPVGRSLGFHLKPGRPLGVAVKAEVDAERVENETLEIHLGLIHEELMLPGYGWVFPLGGGQVNVGVGIASTFSEWKDINLLHLFSKFLASLPADWRMDDVATMSARGQIRGARLPMGLAVWPPWRPRVLAVGDAVGVINPLTGEGISEAIESGLMAADSLIEGLDSSGPGPTDLSAYQRRLAKEWAAYYKMGRGFIRLMGRARLIRASIGLGMAIPPIMRGVVRLRTKMYYRDSEDGLTGRLLRRAMASG